MMSKSIVSPRAANMLSENFSLEELTRSQTAFRRKIDNVPSKESIANLKALCENILEPVRAHFKKSVHVSSGYRSPALCEAIGSSAKSQHTAANNAAAADFGVSGTPFIEVAKFIKDNLDYDQLILEGPPGSMWIHCSYVRAGRANRKMYGVYDGKSYRWGTLKL
jgi:zinc D-Ala-D-Ala carboxypeptidase